MADVKGFREYARLDEDDPAAKLCFKAAVGYAEAAGIPPLSGNTLYDLFVYAVALHFFDNRGFSPGTQVNAIQQSDFADRQITKLKIMLEAEVALSKGGGAVGS
jgi:hypothetical protein